MIEQLKKKHLRNSILLAIVLWVIAAGIGAMAFDSVRGLLSKPVSFNDLKAEDLKEGLRVKGTVDFFMDYYAYETTDDETTAMEFFIPVGEEEYMGFECKGDTMNQAKANMDLYWAYLDGEDVDPESLQSVEVDGVIMPLEGESVGYYYEYIDGLEWTPQEEQIFVPYVLKQGYYGDMDIADLGIMAVAFTALFIGGACSMVSGFRAGNLKQLMAYCETQGNMEFTLSKIEQFYAMGEPVSGVRVNDQYFMAVSGAKVFFSETSHVLWVYQHVTQHRTNFIPTGKTYSLIVKLTDGEHLDIPMKNEKTTNQAIEYIATNLPYLYFGYDENILTLYNTNREEMIRLVGANRQETSGQMEQEDLPEFEY